MVWANQARRRISAKEGIDRFLISIPFFITYDTYATRRLLAQITIKKWLFSVLSNPRMGTDCRIF